MILKAILFDFNGVIVDDEHIQFEAYREVMRPYEVELTEDAYFSRMGMNDRVFVTSVFEETGKPVDAQTLDSITGAKTAKWRESVMANVPLFDGVDNFIRKCAEEFAIGIVSMAKREEIELVLGLAGLRDFFATILSAEDITTYKPDPECYREGFRRIDLYRTSQGHLPMHHGECLAIEDAAAGVQAAKGAGLKALGVTSHVSADALRAAGADAVTDRLDDWMPESIKRVFV